MYIEEVFKEVGVTVIHAKNGKEVVDTFRKNKHIDLVYLLLPSLHTPYDRRMINTKMFSIIIYQNL